MIGVVSGRCGLESPPSYKLVCSFLYKLRVNSLLERKKKPLNFAQNEEMLREN